MSQPIFDQRQGGFRIFVGNLGSRTNISDLQHECERYGPLVDCWVARNPPGFAFVLYKYGEDADSAVRNMDGRMICGQRVRVEHAKARSGNNRNAPTSGGYRGGGRHPRRSFDRSSRSRSNSRERSKKKSSRRRHSSRESTPKHKHRSHSSDSDDSSSDDDKKRRETKSKSKSPNDKKSNRSSRSESKDKDTSNHSKDDVHDDKEKKKTIRHNSDDENASEDSINQRIDQN